jgi:hypothetical protein
VKRPRHATAATHEQLSIPEFAALLGFRDPRGARRWLARHSNELGLPLQFTRVPRTTLELARGLLTGESGYHASARLEAYLKEFHDRPRTPQPGPRG